MKNDYGLIRSVVILPLCYILFILWSSPSHAQKLLIDYQYVIQEIETKLQEGNPMGLRDAALLLERRSVQADALELLKKYTLFTPREFNFSNYTTKEEFLQFFYQRANEIRYSSLLESFYLTPIEERKLLYNIELISSEQQVLPASRLRQHIKRLEKDIEFGDTKSAETQIQRIGQLELDEGYQYLLSLLDIRSFKRKYSALTKVVVQQITDYQQEAALKAILDLLEDRHLSKTFALEQLAYLTNVKIGSESEIGLYTQLLDSLGSVTAIRQFGYDQYFSFRPSFFPEVVDYYGKILMDSDSLEWIQQNVVNDLLRSQHPRSLYYLAVKIYRIAAQKDENSVPLEVLYNNMKDLLAVRLFIPNYQKKYTETFSWRDPIAVQNFAHYWSTHYADYEWDRYRNRFINKTISSTLETRYKRHFKQLTSTNDSVAWHSYLALTEGEPDEVIRLTERYRPVLQNHNPILPPIEYAYLERLAELTAFCKQNNVRYKASDRISPILEKLRSGVSPKERYQTEQQLLQKVNIQDLTALEYEAVLYASNTDFAYSIAWVLDHAYTKYWSKIFANDQLLRLYLKKAYLFKRLGSEGICNMYLKKLEAHSEEDRVRLESLLRLEVDDNIIQQAELILASKEDFELYNWRKLMDVDFNVGLLSEPSIEDVQQIYNEIYETADDRLQLKLMFYLSLYPKLEQVPHLMQLLQAGLMEREAVALLQRIYAYDFTERTSEPRVKWLELWAKDKANYRTWGTQFIEQKLAYLNRNATLSIRDINNIIRSPYYKNEYRSVCLSKLHKVSPRRNLRRLEINPKIWVSSELKYLENMDFKWRELLDLNDVLRVNDPNKLLNFFLKHTANYSEEAAACFYTQLLGYEWFESYLNTDEIDESVLNYLKKLLNKQLSLKNIDQAKRERGEVAFAKLRMIDKSIAEQLKIAIDIKGVDEPTKAALQRYVLKNVTYEELVDVVRNYEQLSAELNYNFLQERFGLPIFDLQNEQTRTDFIQNITQLDTASLYRHYLRNFGVDFENAKAELDFDKIFDILRYDFVYPFSGQRVPRDYYVNSIIKLLELNFQNKTLGFPEHFDQTTRPADRAKRVLTWMRYLEQIEVVKPKQAMPESFTYSYLRPASS
ncbi:MAG: hypothetical protein AAGG68_19620 [Bacteroidota bacterium]